MPSTLTLFSRAAALALTLATLGLPPAASAQSTSAPFGTHDPRGRWISANGNLEVELAPCGAALCGKVTRVLGNRSMAGKGDMQAVDTRPALGMTLLRDLQAIDPQEGRPATAWRGEIYNRENGKTYRCRVSVHTDGHAGGELHVRAYVGLPIFGQTQTWLRATDASSGHATTTPAVAPAAATPVATAPAASR